MPSGLTRAAQQTLTSQKKDIADLQTFAGSGK